MKFAKFSVVIFALLGLQACGSSGNSSSNPTGSVQEPVYPLADNNPEICDQGQSLANVNWDALLDANCHRLSDYALFADKGDPRANPRTPGFLYTLNSELFTDHARKYRYVFLPNNEPMTFSELDSFEFPVGSVIVKVFALPEDTASESESLLEVRLLIRRTTGWVALPYIWNSTFNDAYFSLSGSRIEFSLMHDGVAFSGNYETPTFGNCLTCHEAGAGASPIGPKARHLDKIINVSGSDVNQLEYWQGQGWLTGLPADLDSIDTAPNWQDTSYSLEDRAKAYLDVNCAHCHSEDGSGDLSGLRLEFWRKDINYTHGVCNSAHGWRGGGFDIWPGDSEQSAIPIRMAHIDPKDRMPPLGRSLVHQEAIDLVSDWIDSLPPQNCAE